MAQAAPSITDVKVEFIEFPAAVTPPGNSTKSYFLGGAGERGLVIDGKFIKFTAIGVYLEDKAVPSLAAKWKGKSKEELLESMDFFRDGGLLKGDEPEEMVAAAARRWRKEMNWRMVASAFVICWIG